ncbi:uncharacterized protein [Magallana gigas]|uniref:TNFR-Cys domain-containing protein n=1 Tax=Magallana gigas TaxID=29159 RepID=A0A8W8JW29_MAGGI|nr:uncharacterized protein LOC105331602 isoform X1 [Crassostrea gigas]XP_034339218.1 uncharacterized protein LOC105331602 isoform X1 [Crassostrea gigas]XP_034339219.1 uncharacterized protein LOC105331602 isoform X1 [Crassostrea gigas]XP_034339220.1 uncharacterized protein LOC105331602 isoform X1 [Crassostrea gigas]
MESIGRVFILFACLIFCHSNRVKIRNGIECRTDICKINQKFISCNESGQIDKCVDCQPGTIMLDKMDTYNWETPQECLPSGCNECDLSEAVLDNPDTCGISEMARCVCDLTKLFYGENKHGTATACTKKTGDLCNRPGIQLNQRGECEPCPAGTEKTTNDFSLCKNITESRILTTIRPGTGYQPPITTPSPGGNMSRLSPKEDSIGTPGIVGITVAVVVLLAVSLGIFVYKKRRHPQEKSPSSNNISTDGSSGNSDGNSEKSLLMKSPPSLDLDKNDNKSYVKPTGMVKPMISVDKSKDCEDGDTHFSIEDEVMHQGIPRGNFMAGDNEERSEPSIPLETMGPENSITDVKAEYSADETDLKVPVASVRGRPVDYNTTVKALYSGETQVKQIVTGPSDGRSRRVGAFPLGEETVLKQVGSDNSRAVCQSDNTMVKPFVVSGDTAVKQEGPDLSKKNSEVKIGSVKPSVFLEETNPKCYDSLDTNRTVPVSPSTPEQFTNQRTTAEHNQVYDTNFPDISNGEEHSSPPIQGQTRTYNSSQQNSFQPSVCHTKAESKALNTERVPPSVDTRQLSQNNTSVNAKEFVAPQTQGSLRTSDQVSYSDKIHGQKNCGYLKDGNTTPGVSSVGVTSHGEPERGGSHDDEGGAEEGENLSPRTGSGLMTPRVTPICRPQRVEPVRALQMTAVQPSLQCTVGSVGRVNSKEYDQKEDLNPLHRQISGQNSSGSMCQNSTVENSTASSCYGTARKSEMESSAKNYYSVQGIPSEACSPEPIVINPLLRSESHEANDSHQPVTYNMMHNKSLGLNGLMAAPSLRPDSSDSVSGIAENRDMPMVIKREEIPMPARFEESNRHQVIPNYQIDPATLESGYCS